jgi:hypothetical protein
MSRVGFVAVGVAATLLALWTQEPMAQGLLSGSPQPFDGIMAPAPLGPVQKFGDWSPATEAKSMRLERAPVSQPQQADASRSGQFQAQRRLNPALKPKHTAARSFARQQELQRGVAGSGSLLSLAPIKPARFRPVCFPSSTIHLQPGERDACNGGAPAVRGRFEELLSE